MCIRDRVTDDFIMAGTPEELKAFTDALAKRFTLKNINRGNRHMFHGMLIEQDQSFSVKVSMKEYLDRVKPLQLSTARLANKDATADDRELSEYRSLAGSLLYLGQAVLPHACYVASKMQQRINRLKVHHLRDANDMLADLKRAGATIRYIAPGDIKSVRLASFSDASHGSINETYGQTGFLSGLLVQQDGDAPPLFSVVAWSSHKQHRISYSSYGAEILAAADSDDRGFMIKCAVLEIFQLREFQHELLVDSKSLFETITTLHNSGDYRLRKTVSRMRDSFESEELNVLRWVPDTVNYADAMTKRNLRLNYGLTRMLQSGIWNLDYTRGAKLDSSQWR